MAKQPPPFELFSIGFGGSNLSMRDLRSNEVIGASPEWVIDSRSAPAAYPLGTTPHLMVVFQASNIDVFPQGEAFTIKADGDGLTVPGRTIALSLNPGGPLSVAQVFPMSGAITGAIGIRKITLHWTATPVHGEPFKIGTSTHTIYATWKPAVASDPPLEPAVRAAVKAASGENSVAGIAKALVKAVRRFGITRSSLGGDPRMALLLKHGSSRGISELLVQTLQSQGITATTRAIAINWQQLPATELLWWPSSGAPPTADLHLAMQCFTVIPTGKSVLLCDADLGIGPLRVAMPLPADVKWKLSGKRFEFLLEKYLKPGATRHNTTLPEPHPVLPITPFSVHFRYQGSNAIVLRDLVQDLPVGDRPEWVIGSDTFSIKRRTAKQHKRSRAIGANRDLGPTPAAFVRGAPITIHVTFLCALDTDRGDGNTLTITVGATGTPCGVREQEIALTFDADGKSNTQAFTLDQIISNDVGRTTLKLDWYVRSKAGQQPIGASEHPLYFTWKDMPAQNPDNLPQWAYAQVVRFTSEVAAGATSDRDVCDRVFEHLAELGLRYGVAGWSPRQMLLGGGGMCGGWYQLFQMLAFSQGVFVERTAYLVDWRALAEDTVQWNAIVISKGGINQPGAPPVAATAFHDLDAFPVPQPAKLVTSNAARYRFWGNPDAGQPGDGHAINFLVLGANSVVLYDASFMIGPIVLNMPLPQRGQVLGGADLAEFIEQYLVKAVSHMLGSFIVNGKAVASTPPVGAGAGVNGVTVVTAKLPLTVGNVKTITFRWF